MLHSGQTNSLADEPEAKLTAKKGPCRSRWRGRMRALRIPSFGRSRSSDSRDDTVEPAARRSASSSRVDETDRAAEHSANDEAESRLCEGRPAKTLSGRISFWKRKSANITEYDTTYRVVYLGNVLTGWAKGEGCVDKPLSTLWRNHVGSDKPDIIMKVTVVNSGLRAITKEHGLTEYWANRITYCTAHPSYPRVFCWIYRHEGRKMKQELRCHAVLCPQDETARRMAVGLQDRLHQALVDFRKEKIWRQNARLSLANCLQDNPSMPYRKLLLQAGTTNYKPPIERSKSAPKLTAIEEAEFEEDEEEHEMEDEEEEEYGSTFLSTVVETHADPDRLGAQETTGEQKNGPIATAAAAVFVEEEDDDDDESEEDDEEEEIRSQRGRHMVTDAAAVAAAGLTEEEEEDIDSAQQSQSVSPASQGRSAGGGSSSACSSASAHHRRHCRCRRRRRRRSSPRDGDEDEEEEDDVDCHSLSSDQSDSGHGGEDEYRHRRHHLSIAQGLGKMKVSEQDAISDESGYSEEPIVPPLPPSVAAATAAARETDNAVTMLTVNLTPVRTVMSPTSPSPDDDDSNNKSAADHRLEIMLTGDNCVVRSNSMNHRNNNSSGASTKQSMESSRLQQPKPPRRGMDSISDCLTPPRTPDLSPPMPPATLILRRSSLTATTSPPPPIMPRPTDLTVRSVLLSEFTTSEKLRYIERSNIKTAGGGGGKSAAASLLLNRQEFCINI